MPCVFPVLSLKVIGFASHADDRRALALRSESGALLVGPDNGLLLPAAEALGGVAEAGHRGWPAP